MTKVAPDSGEEKPSYKYNTLFKYVAILTMPIEGFFFFGLINGWPNLVELLKVHGVYANVCENTNSNDTLVNCAERDELFSAAGTLGSIAMNAMTFPLGLILDRYGSLMARYVILKWTTLNFLFRSICTTLMSIGLLLLMFAVEVNWFIYPGVMCLTSGSFALLVTNQALSQLFPKGTAFILVIGQCVFQFSNSVFRLWGMLYATGVSYKTIVTINLCISSVQWVRSFFLMPLAWVDADIAPFYQSPFYRRSLWPKEDIESKRQRRLEKESISPWKIVCSIDFVLFLAWAALGNLDAIFTIFTWSQFSQYVQYETYTELVNLFGGLLWTGALYSVVAGLITDFTSVRMNRPVMEGKVVMVGWLVIVQVISGLVMHGMQYHKSQESALGVVIISNCYRALLYSLAAVYIRCNHSIQVFGTLNGVLRITMGVTSLANFGFVRLVSTYGEDGYMYIILGFSIAILLSTAFPITLLFRRLNK